MGREWTGIETSEGPVEIVGAPYGPIPEGQECPTCMRRMPRKAKPTSPKTKVLSIRIPIDDAERFGEILAAAAKHDGQYEKPHWQYWTVLRGLVRTLQDVPDVA